VLRRPRRSVDDILYLVYPLVFTGAAEIELAGVEAVDHMLEPNEIRLVAPGAMNLVGHGTRNDQRACRGSNRHVGGSIRA
jgi:hypothetical protein